MYSAALQYKLDCGQKNTQPSANSSTKELGADSKKKNQPCFGGSPSITLQYDNGMDRDMLQEIKKVTLKLTYAY